MSTDLKTVQDHPAAILRKGPTGGIALPTANAMREHAATMLDRYEAQHNVTFAALDNDALKAVREAYAEASKDRSGYSHLAYQCDDDLRRAICDLLSLGE